MTAADRRRAILEALSSEKFTTRAKEVLYHIRNARSIRTEVIISQFLILSGPTDREENRMRKLLLSRMRYPMERNGKQKARPQPRTRRFLLRKKLMKVIRKYRLRRPKNLS